MSTRPPETATEIFHVYNRGVEKRKIFLDDSDYVRFIHDLYEFNDAAPAPKLSYYLPKNSEVEPPNLRNRKMIVDIMAFCLMPNHFHLLIKQRVDGGLALFMKKLMNGYTLHFNQKYERSGVLFQGKYKFAPIIKEAHFIHIPYYIHLNPLDLIAPEWREREMHDSKKVDKFLQAYRWSSHLDYSGIKNFPSVTSRDFLLSAFGSSQNYTAQINNWIKSLDLNDLKTNKVLLE